MQHVPGHTNTEATLNGIMGQAMPRPPQGMQPQPVMNPEEFISFAQRNQQAQPQTQPTMEGLLPQGMTQEQVPNDFLIRIIRGLILRLQQQEATQTQMPDQVIPNQTKMNSQTLMQTPRAQGY